MVLFSGAFDKYINTAVKFDAILPTGRRIVAVIKEVAMLKYF
jgi:hypothetical protein